MAITNNIDPAADADLLHKLFIEHVRKQLKDKIKVEAEKVIDECVDQAIESMKLTINTAYNAIDLDRYVKIILEKK